MQAEKESVIELEPGTDGVFRAVRVSKREEEEEKPKKVKRQRATKSSQRREMERIAQSFHGSPQVEQFLCGANMALDLVERFRKVFK